MDGQQEEASIIQVSGREISRAVRSLNDTAIAMRASDAHVVRCATQGALATKGIESDSPTAVNVAANNSVATSRRIVAIVKRRTNAIILRGNDSGAVKSGAGANVRVVPRNGVEVSARMVAQSGVRKNARVLVQHEMAANARTVV